VARAFGASYVADAFYVAYRIPSLLRELFAEGSMSAAFVPVFTRTLATESRDEARRLARAAFSLIVVVVTAITVLGVVFAPPLVALIAPGFGDDPGKAELTARLTRIMFPYLLWISLAALAMGVLNSLRAVSDAWLSEKNTKEKQFSMGFFDPDYLKRFPTAVVRRADEIIAFANVWPGAEKEELSIDLMRHLPSAPNGIMDYLFAELMLWGKAEGYRWFSLGMAPMSGFEDRSLAPIWHKLGTFVFRHGEHFYNFQGLRQYKEKFSPQWQPRYLACPRGLMLPRILTNLATLISGGVKGVVTKQI